jgi:hypothetical protein
MCSYYSGSFKENEPQMREWKQDIDNMKDGVFHQGCDRGAEKNRRDQRR